MSDLAAALAAEPRGRTSQQCGICKLLDDLDAADAALLRSAVDDVNNVQGSQIGRALRKVGHRVADDVVTRHRREHLA